MAENIAEMPVAEPETSETKETSDVAKPTQHVKFLDERDEKAMHLSRQRYRKLNKTFGFKEILDRIGYGFGAHQYVTILFFLSGAGAFFVGIINALRDIISDVLAALVRSYAEKKTLGMNFISSSGILFGFSFFGILLAVRTGISWLFAVSLLIGSVGVVAYGHLYKRILDRSIRHEKKSRFLRGVAHYGLLITAAAFFIGGLLLQSERLNDAVFSIGGFSFPLSGQLIIFEIAAIVFIISGFVLRKFIPHIDKEERTYSFRQFLREYRHERIHSAKLFFHNKHSIFLFLGALLVSAVQCLGATYYGYTIYIMFETSFFGGFLNVAIIFSVAIVASFLGPFLTRFVQRKAGLAPMFVFGTLLMALLPLILIFNPHFYAILVATSLAIIGSSIVGVAQGLLTQKLLSTSKRLVFFQSLRLLLILPFLLLVGGGAALAQLNGYPYTGLFRIIVAVLLFIVTPLYFWLVILANKKRL